jgi:hypothetical protein
MQVSWSFMRGYEACPYQQKLIRIDKLGPEKPDERRFIRGTTGHRFFELWAKSSFDDSMKPEVAANIFWNDPLRLRSLDRQDQSTPRGVRV